MATRKNICVTPLGDAALLVTMGGERRAARERIASLLATCEQSRLEGVTDLVPAFATLGVFFDPAVVAIHDVSQWIAKLNDSAPDRYEAHAPRLVEVPVCYDGVDLEEVAERAGLSVEDVIVRHSEAEHRVGAVGFAPGFAYLEGQPIELHTPRRTTPRANVPAGTVAIGGSYTGIYPQDSPGGWNLIGRTTTRLFNTASDPPALLQVGDRVRLRVVPRLEAEPPITKPAPPTLGQPVLKVVSPGVQSTLQGLGRHGWQAMGVTPGGAMDPVSLQLANLLAGAPRDAWAIEATLVGPVLEAMKNVTLGIAGAQPAGHASPRRVRLEAGERLDLRRLTNGARCYVAIAGGFASEAAIAENLVLQKNDELLALRPSIEQNNAAPATPNPAHIGPQKTNLLRTLPGPQAAMFDAAATARFYDSEYCIAAQSNRMGLRCEGPALKRRSLTEIESQPVTHGVVQTPPDGQPVILGADRQTLGGYPVIACVVAADLPKIGQLAPGDAVRFEPIDLAGAERLRQESDRWLALAAAGIANHEGRL